MCDSIALLVREQYAMAGTGIAAVWQYFKDTYPNMAAFKADWERLTEQDKADLRTGISDGTLTY